MIEVFLVVFYFAGLIVATAQDIKRQEVDNWLNLLLLVGGIAYLVFKASILSQQTILLNLLLFLAVMYLIENLFYFGHVFAGGDSKLLFALTPLFISSSAASTSLNIFIYIMLLLISGSVYGMSYTFYLYIKNAKDINKNLKLKKILFFLFLSALFFVLSKFNFLFFIAGFVALFPAIILFSATLEKVVMIKEVSGSKLREGDWLAENIQIGKHKIKSTWDGLTKKDLKLLKNVKRVKIKEGIPFVPSFLIGFILYILLKNQILAKISLLF